MRSYLFTVLAFAALLLGVTTACNRDPIPIGVLEKELVGMWWDEYEYHDVTEDGVPFDREYKWAGITALGDATLVLEGNNIVRGFESSFPGIFVPEGKTLTITGAGKLDVSGNGYAPGIGSGYHAKCGNISISACSLSAIITISLKGNSTSPASA